MEEFILKIKTDEKIEKALFAIYLDVKKRRLANDKVVNTGLKKIDCKCDKNTEYSIK